MKNFIHKISRKEMILAGISIVCLLVVAIIMLLETIVKERLYDQQVANRWSADGGVTQVSSFFAQGEIEEPIYFLGVASRIDKVLQEASIVSENENARLWMDAVSLGGKINISYNGKKVETDAVGVKGDYFRFHIMNLQSGSLLLSDNLLTDGIVIDEEIAWQLFGSNDVAGMQVMIGEVPHFISGVIKKEAGKMAKAAGLEKPICYLSLESLLAYGQATGGYCHEIVLPNPVAGFGVSIVNKAVEAETRKVQVVENTGRYEVLPLLRIIQSFSTRSMSKQEIVYPYWENIARGYEDIFSLTLLLKLLSLCTPAVVLLRGVVLLWKKKTWTVESTWQLMNDKIYDYQVKHPRKQMKRGQVYAFGAVLAALGLTFTVVFLLNRINEGKGGGRENSDGLAADAANSKEFIYQQEEIKFGTGSGYLSQFVVQGDTIYVEEVVTETVEVEEGAEDTQPKMHRLITAYDPEGKEKKRIRLEWDSNSSTGPFTVDAKGNIYSIRTRYGIPGSEEESKDRVYLEGYSNEGEPLFSDYLNETVNSDTYFHVNSLFVQEDQQLVMGTSEGVMVLDLQGNRLREIPVEHSEGFRLLKLRQEQLAIGKGEGQDFLLQTLDPATGQLGEEQKLPFPFYQYSIFAGKVFDLYLTDNSGIYGYNLGGESPVKIMDFLASDVSTYGMNQLAVVDEGTLFGQYYSDLGDKLARFTKVNPEDIIEREELVLGCYYLDMNVKQMIIDFNKASRTHRIRAVEYNQYNTEADYSQGMTRLNADIVSGNPPDIMILQSGMPVDSYIAQGVFADYNELMEADTEFNKEAYLPNILEALSTNGKLYQLIPSFNVSTYVGKKAEVGEGSGWNMEEVTALLDSKPEGTALFQWMTQQRFLYNMMHVSVEEYVDWETGMCYFSGDAFTNILNFAKTLPAEIVSSDDMTESDRKEEATQFRDGRTLLMDGQLSTFKDYGQWKYATFGEDINMIGFPTESKNGSAITYDFNLAISARSRHKNAAWEFIKIFLEKEYQDKISYGFPLRIESLEALAKRSQEKPYYLDEQGNKHEYDEYYYVGDQEIKAAPLTQEEVQDVMAMLKRVNRIAGYDSSLTNIVTEEAALFFAGEKTASEAAKIIQSRAQIYVNENR